MARQSEATAAQPSTTRRLGFSVPPTGSSPPVCLEMAQGSWANVTDGRTCGKNQNKSAPTCGSRNVAVSALASRPNPAQSQPIPLREPPAWQRFGFRAPAHGRVLAKVLQIAAARKPKTPENNPLQPKRGEVRISAVKRRDSWTAGNRWPIIPKRMIDRPV